MLDEEQARSLDEFRASMEEPGQPQFLVRLAGDDTPVQNRGITRLSLRRDAAQPNRWHLLTQLKNYGDAKADVVLKLSINGEPLGQRKVALAPNELVNAEDEFTWDKGGLLQAEISPSDALEADNRAIVNLPTFRIVRVAVFTGSNSPFATDLLSVLSSNPYLHTEIVPPGTNVDVPPDVAIYQGTSVPAQSAFNSIWFLGGTSPSASRSVRATQWNSQHPGDALGSHARRQRAQSGYAQRAAWRYRTGLHRRKSAGAVDFGARTEWAQASDHRIRSSRLQFSAGIGFSVVDGRGHGMDDAFRG